MPVGPICYNEDQTESVSFFGTLVLRVVVGATSCAAQTTLPNFYCAFICCGSLGGCNPQGCAWADIDCGGGNLTPSDALEWLKAHTDYTCGRAQGVCQSSGSWLATDGTYDYFWCFADNVICPNSACFAGEYQSNFCSEPVCGFVWVGACGYEISCCNMIGNAGGTEATIGYQQYDPNELAGAALLIDGFVNGCSLSTCQWRCPICLGGNGGTVRIFSQSFDNDTKSWPEYCNYSDNPFPLTSLHDCYSYLSYDTATKRFWHTTIGDTWKKI
jgi:hypothetical protein